MNAAIVCAVCAAIYSLPGSKPDGVSVLAYFLTAGFCFWGITVLNIWFCFAGVLIGCLIRKVKFYTQGNVFLFSTGIAPLMTDLLIRYPGAESRGVTLFGAVLTLLVCTVIGLILPAGLAHSPKVHKGYDLYSAAVPVGLTAFFLRAVLYRVLGGTLPDGVGVGAGDGNWAVCNIFCIAVFVLALVLGLGLGGSFRQYGELLKDSGFGADYGAKYGTGTAILNFAIYGLFIVLYYNLIGAKWNAATLGCVFCMVCCCFKGSHPANVWPRGGGISHKGALRGARYGFHNRHQCAGHCHRPLLCKRSEPGCRKLWLAGRRGVCDASLWPGHKRSVHTRRVPAV